MWHTGLPTCHSVSCFFIWFKFQPYYWVSDLRLPWRVPKFKLLKTWIYKMISDAAVMFAGGTLNETLFLFQIS